MPRYCSTALTIFQTISSLPVPDELLLAPHQHSSGPLLYGRLSRPPEEDDDDDIEDVFFARNLQAARNGSGNATNGTSNASNATTWNATSNDTASTSAPPPTPIPCQGEFGNWTRCGEFFPPDYTNTSLRARTYLQTTPATGSGLPCPFANNTVEKELCADCVGSFSNWSTCANGTQSRNYTHTRAQFGAGDFCPHEHNAQWERDCGTWCVGNWSDWSTCTNGVHHRNFSHTIFAEDGGRDCENPHNEGENKTCGVACVGEWSNWTSCADGTQDRRYNWGKGRVKSSEGQPHPYGCRDKNQ